MDKIDLVQQTMDRVNEVDNQVNEDVNASALPPITGGENCQTVSDLREHVLKHAGVLVDQFLNMATGRPTAKASNSFVRSEVWGVVKELILTEGHKVNLECEATPMGIVTAVMQGKCTIDEAEKILALHGRANEIENGVNGSNGDFPFIQFSVKQPDGHTLEGVQTHPVIEAEIQ